MSSHRPRSSAPLALLLLGACGSPGPAPVPVPDAGVPRPELTACADKWEVVLAGQPYFTPRALRWSGGHLYFGAGPGSRLQSVPATGGTPRVIVDEPVWSLWLEGDQLLFTSPNRNNDQLLSAPLTGGAPAVVIDGATSATVGSSVHSFVQALDASFFYWDVDLGVEHSIWSMARAGGTARKLAVVPHRGLIERLTPTADALVVSTRSDDSLLVPKAGGDFRRLNKGGDLLGADAESVLWATTAVVRGNDVHHELTRSRLDGQTELFWPSKPPALRPQQAWPDGEGGWVMAAVEMFSDLEVHLSIWLVDPDQNGIRVACDRLSNRDLGLVVGEPALAPDAIYLPVAYPGPATATWSLVKVPR